MSPVEMATEEQRAATERLAKRNKCEVTPLRMDGAGVLEVEMEDGSRRFIGLDGKILRRKGA